MRRHFVFLLVALAARCASAADVAGIPIHYATHGAGPATLVFVHGWTCDATSWDQQVPRFSEDYRVVTLDLPGHGQSGAPGEGEFSMDLFARAVEAVRAEVGAQEIVLIGHSMGVPVIREYARDFPEHTAGLFAVDGPLTSAAFPSTVDGENAGPPTELPAVGGPNGLAVREAMIRSMFTSETPEAVQTHVLEMMLGAPAETAAGAMTATWNPAVWNDDPVPMPAFAVYAGTASMPDAAAMREVVPRYEAAQVAGTGHFVMLEKPEEFNRLLVEFLEEIDF